MLDCNREAIDQLIHRSEEGDICVSLFLIYSFFSELSKRTIRKSLGIFFENKLQCWGQLFYSYCWTVLSFNENEDGLGITLGSEKYNAFFIVRYEMKAEVKIVFARKETQKNLIANENWKLPEIVFSFFRIPL